MMESIARYAGLNAPFGARCFMTTDFMGWLADMFSES